MTDHSIYTKKQPSSEINQNPFIEEEEKDINIQNQQHYFTASFKNNGYQSNCYSGITNSGQVSYDDIEDEQNVEADDSEFPLNQQVYSTTKETNNQKTPKAGPKQINTFSAKLFSSKSSQKFDYDSGTYIESQFNEQKHNLLS